MGWVASAVCGTFVRLLWASQSVSGRPGLCIVGAALLTEATCTTSSRQDACPQHRVIAAGLRQRTATRHVGQEPRKVASFTELTGQGGLSGPRSASATKLRQQLHWLPIRQRITYKISLITYKTRTTGTPTYLSNLFHDYVPTRTRSSNKL